MRTVWLQNMPAYGQEHQRCYDGDLAVRSTKSPPFPAIVILWNQYSSSLRETQSSILDRP